MIPLTGHKDVEHCDRLPCVTYPDLLLCPQCEDIQVGSILYVVEFVDGCFQPHSLQCAIDGLIGQSEGTRGRNNTFASTWLVGNLAATLGILNVRNKLSNG